MQNRTMLPKASDIYTIRMLIQPMAGGMIESCDPDGQCKGIREALLATATGEDATTSSIDENPKASDIHLIRMLTQFFDWGRNKTLVTRVVIEQRLNSAQGKHHRC